METTCFHTYNGLNNLQTKIDQWVKEIKKSSEIIDIKYLATERHGDIVFSSIVIHKNEYFNLQLRVSGVPYKEFKSLIKWLGTRETKFINENCKKGLELAKEYIESE